jgi:hypothetical protein
MLGDSTPEDEQFRRLLARIVEQFGDDPHWENFFSRAYSSHADGDYESATALYEKAKQCILDDRKLPHRPDWSEWEERVKTIQIQQDRARGQKPLLVRSV